MFLRIMELQHLAGKPILRHIYLSQAFANHLASVFQPHPPEPHSLPEDTLTSFLETPFQLEPSIQRLKRSEVQAIIKDLPLKKSPGYELMFGKQCMN
jgi:hypothetical protein